MSLRKRKINFDEVFRRFMGVVQQMYNPIAVHAPEPVKGMDLYHDVYLMCNNQPRPMNEELFLRLADFLEAQTTNVAARIYASDHLLQSYAAEWDIFQFATETLNTVSDMLNRTMEANLRGAPMTSAMRAFQGQHPNVGNSRYRRQSMESLAYSLWKERVFRHLRRELIGSTMEVVRIDREGIQGPHDAAKALALSLVTLQPKKRDETTTMGPTGSLYLSEYEAVFLAETKKYYEQESRRVMRDLSISEFMKTAEDRLKQEYHRALRFLHPSSVDKVTAECHAQYIDAHKHRIHDAFLGMLQNRVSQDCKLAYELMALIPGGIHMLTDVYEKYVTEEGRRLVSKDPKTLANNLGQLHANRMADITQMFRFDPSFVAALDKAFRSIINDTATHAPDLLAKYCDQLLRKPSKLSETETEDQLTVATVLFHYIDDKDVFQKHYARYLAKRLIYRQSASDDLEYLMLTKLKVACGVEYTAKLQRMFTDVQVSQETGTEFHAQVDKPNASEFNALVLTAGAWPFTQASAASQAIAQLPLELANGVAAFTEFYNTKHSGRKLFWLWNLCRADVKLTGYDKRYELNLTAHQLTVLLLFNDADTIATATIASVLGGTRSDADKIIQSLIDAQLLLPSPGGTVSVNKKFSSKRIKLKLTASSGESSSSGGGAATPTAHETDRSLDEDRKLYLQAIIVRIMKSRRELSHTELVPLVVDQAKARFVPSVVLVKKCIEQLIDKQYLDRAEHDHDRYLYMA
ncbi:hypothetical protein GGF32_003421 [Allomyces javanicus]|nr:hypothetical protein GGF32_003421 [Allomyces javanicus]